MSKTYPKEFIDLRRAFAVEITATVEKELWGYTDIFAFFASMGYFGNEETANYGDDEDDDVDGDDDDDDDEMWESLLFLSGVQ